MELQHLDLALNYRSVHSKFGVQTEINAHNTTSGHLESGFSICFETGSHFEKARDQSNKSYITEFERKVNIEIFLLFLT